MKIISIFHLYFRKLDYTVKEKAIKFKESIRPTKSKKW